MEEREIKKWEIVRSKGAFKYIMGRGIITGLLSKILPDLILKKEIIFSDILTWIELGVAILVFLIVYLLAWIVSEFKYKRSIN